jgi:hypothetical protein
MEAERRREGGKEKETHPVVARAERKHPRKGLFHPD